MSPVPGIVSSTQQVLKIWWTKNKDEFCFPALGHPSVISLSASIPRLECVPPGSDFSTSSRVAGGVLFGLSISGFPPRGADSGTHGWGVSRSYEEPPCLRTSVVFSTRAGIELRPRSLLALPDVGITALDIKPTRVRARRRELNWEARAPLPHPPLHLGRSPLRTRSFSTPPGPGGEIAPGLVGSGAGVA